MFHRTLARHGRTRARAAVLPLVLLACEPEVVAPADEDFREGVITVNASSTADYAYVSLTNGGIVVVPDDPANSEDWDLAFRRTGVRLNGGVAGPGNVAGHNLGHNSSVTAEQIVALTPADGEAAFAAVAAADIPAADSFAADGLAPEPGATWFRFDPLSGTLAANPRNAWKVREGSGGFALFRVIELRMQGQRPLGLAIEYRHQEAGEALGPPSTIDVDFARGPGFVSFSEGALADSAGCGWDIAPAPQLSIDVNADCDAGTFPLDPSQSFTEVTLANDAPAYGGFVAVMSGAFPSSVDDASGIFWYNIQRNSRMWPTYNVFLVRSGEEVYKVQIVSYYNANGESGHPTVRFQRLR